ncbi:MAG: COX15/CtaA family protein [Dehalococcoidia bacterium]
MVRARGIGGAPSAALPATLWFRWLALATTLTTYALIILGGVVRVTDSGDACPDWPRCHGDLLPPLDTQVLVEFSHRLVASVISILIAATAFAAWRWRHAPIIRWGAGVAVVLVIAQIILGGITVLNDLHSNLVTAHLALASALLATLVVITIASFDPASPVPTAEQREKAASFRNLLAFAALATFALMLTGSYVSGSGAGLAFDDWPLFNGRLMPDGGRLAMIHATHRFAAAAVGLIVVYVTARAWRTQRWQPLVMYAVLAALGVYVAQVFVGAANVWTMLQPSAAGAHLALAAGMWAVLAGATFLAHRTVQASGLSGESTVSPAVEPEAAPASGGS